MSYEVVKQIYLDLFDSLPPVGILPSVSVPLTEIYRCRTIEEGDDISQWNSFSYPHDTEDVKQGRANIKGHPVLYGSFTEDSAIREVINARTEKENVYVGTWAVNSGVTYNLCSLILPTQEDFNITLNEHYESIATRFKKMVRGYSIEKQEAIRLLYEKISSYFLLENDTTLSSFFSHFFLYDGFNRSLLRADIILYPGLKSGKKTFNLAIHKDFADRNMSLCEVKYKMVQEFVSNGTYVSPLAFGQPKEDRTIDWYHDLVLEEKNILLKRIGYNLYASSGINDPHSVKINTISMWGKQFQTEVFKQQVSKMYFDELSKNALANIDNNDPYCDQELNIELCGPEEFLKADTNFGLLPLKSLLLEFTFRLSRTPIKKNTRAFPKGALTIDY